MSSIELFAGAGGLAMGMCRAGFSHAAIVEWDNPSCGTIALNKNHYGNRSHRFELFNGDARHFDYTPYIRNTDVVSGGPPCQPFSLGGKHRGNTDNRDMFPTAVKVVRDTHPRAFIFENVKGLLRASFASYFEYVCLQLKYPHHPKRKKETWEQHLSRLETVHSSKYSRPRYRLFWRLLNAADYGVPQKRERVFLVGVRSDLNLDWHFPEPTHSENELLRSKWIDGSYWERHRIATRNRPELPARQETKVHRLATRDLTEQDVRPWRTVQDAIADLPDPECGSPSHISNHVFVPGARVYKGHIGSPLHEPSKALKAGDHGVPGGENMLVKADGSVRYYTVREAARMQTFPDTYQFEGVWSETMRQLGNAVPVQLAEIVASSVYRALNP